jgi:hypothetical protein
MNLLEVVLNALHHVYNSSLYLYRVLLDAFAIPAQSYHNGTSSVLEVVLVLLVLIRTRPIWWHSN